MFGNLRAETARLVEDNNRLAAKLSAASTAEPAMTAQDARELLAKKPCTHCGYLHPTTAPACPRIASVTFSADGNALAVRYWPHGQWPTEGSHPDELAAIIAAEQANSEIADE